MKINYDFLIMMLSDKIMLNSNMEFIHYGLIFDIRMMGKTLEFDGQNITLDSTIIVDFNKIDKEDFIKFYNKIFKYTMDIPLKYLKIKDIQYIINKDKVA